MDTFLSSDTLISPTLCFYLLQYQLVRSRASFSRFRSTWTFCNCSALKSPSVSLLALGKIMLIICHVAVLIQYILLLNLNLNLSCKVGLTGLTLHRSTNLLTLILHCIPISSRSTLHCKK